MSGVVRAVTERTGETLRAAIGCTPAVVALALVAIGPAEAQDLQEKVAAAKQAAPQNQQALRAYTWVEIDVDTWKDNPSDKVTLDVQMQSLPDGTSYAGGIVLAIPSSKIEVRITNSNDQEFAP